MELEFVPSTEDGAPDWSGSLKVTATTPVEVMALAKHFRLFDESAEGLRGLSEALTSGTLTHISHGSKKNWAGEARPWFECIGVCLPLDFMQPYKDAAARYLGWDIPAGLTLDLTAARGVKLGHTHTVTTIRLEDGCIVADVLKEDYSAEKAEASAPDYLGEEIGARKHEPEYIPCGNGLYKNNPNYLRRYPSSPAFACEWLWNALVAYWEEHEATEEQKRIIAAAWALHPDGILHHHPLKATGFPTLSAPSTIYYKDDAGTCDYDGKGTMASIIKIGDFAELGKVRA